MNNVTINKVKFEVKGDTPVRLENGSLVVHYDKSDNVKGAYIVTSFRDNKNRYSGSNTAPYCSLVNLDSGYLKFEERCSRNTTIKRVLSHLNPSDVSGTEAVRSGQYIEVYPVGNYKIDLSF